MSSARVFWAAWSWAAVSLLRCWSWRECSREERTSRSSWRWLSFSFCSRTWLPSVLSLLLLQRSQSASSPLIWCIKLEVLRRSCSRLRSLWASLSLLRRWVASRWWRASRLSCCLRATSFLMLGYLSASCFFSSITSNSRIFTLDCFSSTSPSPRFISFYNSKLLRPNSMFRACSQECCSRSPPNSRSLASHRGRSRSLLACTLSMSSLSDSSLARIMEQVRCSWCISSRRASSWAVTAAWQSVNSTTRRRAGTMTAGAGLTNCCSEQARPSLYSISRTMNMFWRKGRLDLWRSMSSPMAWASETRMLRMAAGSQGRRQCVKTFQMRALSSRQASKSWRSLAQLKPCRLRQASTSWLSPSIDTLFIMGNVQVAPPVSRQPIFAKRNTPARSPQRPDTHRRTHNNSSYRHTQRPDLQRTARIETSKLEESSEHGNRVANFNDFLIEIKRQLTENSVSSGGLDQTLRRGERSEVSEGSRQLVVNLKLENEKLQLEKYKRLVERQLSKSHSIEHISLENRQDREKVLTIRYDRLVPEQEGETARNRDTARGRRDINAFHEENQGQMNVKIANQRQKYQTTMQKAKLIYQQMAERTIQLKTLIQQTEGIPDKERSIDTNRYNDKKIDVNEPSAERQHAGEPKDLRINRICGLFQEIDQLQSKQAKQQASIRALVTINPDSESECSGTFSRLLSP